MSNRKALRRYIYKTPLPGGIFIMLGAVLMLVWAVWEFAVRYDAAVAVWKGQYQLVLDGYITKEIMIKNILKVPETKNAILIPVILALIALFSLIVLLFHSRWFPAFFIIPVCTLVIFYHTSNSLILRVLNLFESIKLYSCLGIIGGETLNLGVALIRRFHFKKQLRERERMRLEARKRKRSKTNAADIRYTESLRLPSSEPSLRYGSQNTLIPEKTPKRKPSSRSYGM